jgi:hypothetical protein
LDVHWLRMSGFSEKYRERGHEPFFSRPPGVGKKRIEGWDVLLRGR